MLNNFSDQQKIKIAKTMKKKQPITKSALTKDIGADTLKLLIEFSLVNEILPTGRARAIKYEFKKEAKDLFSQVKITRPRKKTTKKRTKAPTMEITVLQPLVLQIMNPYFEALEKRISSLEENIVTSSIVKEKSKEFNIENFLTDLKHQYDWINERERKGGMVPIPRLWDKLKKDGYARKDFENALFELEKRRIIDLQTASDHKLLKEPEKAIRHPKRGYINYVVWRR